MEHEKLLESLLWIIFLIRDENDSCLYSDAAMRLHEKGTFIDLAEEDMTLKSLIASDDFKDYVELYESEEGTRIQLTTKGLEMARELNEARYSNPQNLFTWAFMGHFDTSLQELAGMALPESWEDADGPFGILRRYIVNTFRRLLYERKEEHNRLAIVETERWAAFNTGLVDRMYDPIYALFALNKKKDMQKWTFHSWCTPGNKRAGQTLSRYFEELPRKASYFSHPAELIYDENAGVPTLPFEHILDRLNRLPLSFLREYAPEGVEVPADGDEISDAFFDSYKEALTNPENGMTCLRFKDALELSLRRAVRRVTWNYRLVIPIYDAKRRRLMLLIPMTLDQRYDKADIALMVERAKTSGRYVGHTIYTLGMAYAKARMIMRPEADWLLRRTDPTAPTRTEVDDDDLIEAMAENDVAAMAADKALETEAKKEEQKEQVTAGDAFLHQHETDDIYRPEDIYSRLKIVDKVSLEDLNKGRKRTFYPSQKSADEEDTQTSYERRGYWRPDDGDINIRGVFRESYGHQPFIQVGTSRFQAREFTDEGLIDGDDVVFDIETEDNRWKAGRFFYAVNIRITDD